MQDKDKTKEELLDELVAMRQRIAEIEASSTQQQLLEAALQAERSFADTLLDVTDGLLQSFLKSVLELDNTLVVVYDLEGRIINFNQTCEETSGYSFDEVRGKLMGDLFLIPAEVEAASAAFAEVLACRSARHYTNYWLTKQGSHRLISWSLAPLLAGDGEVQYVISTGVDITETAQLMQANQELQAEIAEREKAEAKLALLNEHLQESEERFRLLIEGVKDYAFFILDRKGYIISWNKGAERITGYKALEIVGEHFSCLCPPEDIERGKPYLELQVATAQGRYEEEGWRMRKDGSRFFANVAVTALRDENGSLRGFSHVTRDVTSRKRDEEMLQKWGEIFQHTGQGLIIMSPGSRFLETINPALAAMHGYALEELSGQRFSTIIAPECLEETFEHILVSYDYEKYSFESLHVRKDKTIFPVFIEVTNVRRNEEEKVLYRIFNVQDITERKQAEAEAQKAMEKEKQLLSTRTHLISIASHEFRTPLSTILSANELLKYYSHKLPDTEKKDLYRQVETATKHMLELIDNFLAMSKADSEAWRGSGTAAKADFKPVPLDLEEFCCQLLSEMHLNAGKKHELVFTMLGDCTSAVMDAKILRHVFTNLLSNAIKYSPAGGMVEFSIDCQDGNAIFKVKDSGIGIPPEDLENLFEAFHRASNVGNIPGTGLGLSIVKNMVNLHGGTITVESEVEVGTTFVVNIPLSSKNR